MLTVKVFLASSSELKEDRKEFEILINRKNKDWVARDVFLELIVWEDFLDAVSQSRLQDEYNKAIRECDIFVMLFCTKVGQYTGEEFEIAFGQFQATNKPLIFTYFKDTEINTGSAVKKELTSLLAFQEKLTALGHLQTVYKNIDELKFHFSQQLDKLAASGFIELKLDKAQVAAPGCITYQAKLTGSGAIAQGVGTLAAGRGAVVVGGNNTSHINTGTQTKIDTGGGAFVGGSLDTGGGEFVGRDKIIQGIPAKELEPLFAPLLAAVVQHAPPDKRAAAVQQVQELKAEVAKGKHADDSKLGKIVDGLAALVPGATGAVASMFATPLLGGIAGPVTKFVLDKLKVT
jgi:hypothetical protein